MMPIVIIDIAGRNKNMIFKAREDKSIVVRLKAKSSTITALNRGESYKSGTLIMIKAANHICY